MRLLVVLMIGLGLGAARDSSAATAAYAALPMTPEQRVLNVEPERPSDPAVEPAMHAAPEPQVASAPEQLAPPDDDPLVDAALTCPTNVTGIRPVCDGCSYCFAGIDVGATGLRHANSAFGVSDDNVGVSIRPYVGWENYNGVGFRVQAWLFGVEPQLLLAGTSSNFELEFGAGTLDVELYKRINMDSTSIVLGAGTRGAGVVWKFPDNSEDKLSVGGFSAFTEIRHPFYVGDYSEWAWIGGGRISALSGQGEFDNLIAAYSKADTSMSITEANLGIEYRSHGNASDFVLRLLFEEQVWNTDALGSFAFSTARLGAGLEW